MQWTNGEFTISDQREDLDVAMIHRFLADSYWAKGIDRGLVERSIAHSLCLGVFHKANQVGFGRAVTDRATFAYLADVFVIQEYRGQGLGTWLVDCFFEHQELQGLRRWMLATRDAHGLYLQKGFVPLALPECFMEKKPTE